MIFIKIVSDRNEKYFKQYRFYSSSDNSFVPPVVFHDTKGTFCLNGSVVSCQQECQNCSPRMTKLCILKFLLKKIQLSSFFLYLNIPKNTFKHFLKMILNFDNLLNLFVPFIWHFTQCHFSSFNPIYIPLYHILYASLSLIFIFSDSDDVRSASS